MENNQFDRHQATGNSRSAPVQELQSLRSAQNVRSAAVQCSRSDWQAARLEKLSSKLTDYFFL
jgi:hypothetical protein